MALAWCFEEEFDAQVVKVLQDVARDGALVPAIWALEVANGLLMGKRRGRLNEAAVERFATLFIGLPLKVDCGSMEQGLRVVLPLAARLGLTVYDAAYLELAMRLGIPLATRDRQLAAAAQGCGVSLYPDAC